MATIQGASQSPRVADNILYWYVGNTFTLEWTITLYDDTTLVVYNDKNRIY